MTPELPRAPRRRALALVWATAPTPAGAFFFSSAAAVEMVMLMLVPVSPSGTGKTLSSLICCFWELMEAAAWITIWASDAPSMVPLMSNVPFYDGLGWAISR